MAWMKVLTEEDLDHIISHKYAGSEYTELDKLMNSFWLSAAEMMPRWLAPNLITFLGFVPVVLVFLLGWITVPFFDTAMPRWLAFSFAAALFFYQTMDAVDGKQARRTGSSSPLGHLIDHGCDCLTALCQHSALSLVLVVGDARWVLLCMQWIMSDAFLAAWQECHIGTFPTNFGPVGVTESQFALMLFVAVSGILGPEAWQSLVSDPMELPWANQSLGILVLQAFLLQCFGLAVVCLVGVFTAPGCRKGAALKDLLPILFLNLLLRLWQPDVVSSAVRLICLCSGLSFFYINAQMIVFSMARRDFPLFQQILMPYAALVLLSWAAPLAWLRLLLWGYAVVLGCWLLWWLLSIVQQLKVKLGIYVFCITKKNVDGAKTS